MITGAILGGLAVLYITYGPKREVRTWTPKIGGGLKVGAVLFVGFLIFMAVIAKMTPK